MRAVGALTTAHGRLLAEGVLQPLTLRASTSSVSSSFAFEFMVQHLQVQCGHRRPGFARQHLALQAGQLRVGLGLDGVQLSQYSRVHGLLHRTLMPAVRPQGGSTGRSQQHGNQGSTGAQQPAQKPAHASPSLGR